MHCKMAMSLLLQESQMPVGVSKDECKKEVNGEECMLSMEYRVQF